MLKCCLTACRCPGLTSQIVATDPDHLFDRICEWVMIQIIVIFPDFEFIENQGFNQNQKRVSTFCSEKRKYSFTPEIVFGVVVVLDHSQHLGIALYIRYQSLRNLNPHYVTQPTKSKLYNDQL